MIKFVSADRSTTRSFRADAPELTFPTWAAPGDQKSLARPADLHERCEMISRHTWDLYPPGHQSHQPKTVGPAFVGVIRIRQRRCLIIAVR
jgi:hypothetical protein